MTFTATYSPEDNKIRLSASSRLDKELYLRVKAAGFIWAPKQDLFVAPMWTPAREDLALELAGEIGDEDTSLVDRAEDRAERFDGYRENRTADAERAHRAVAAIADGIPFGQPILIGHHSERHARRDAEKIENGMRKAVKMWDTAQYWKSRAAGAIHHAKYKELPAVRARRIKGLESDLRKQLKTRAESEKLLKFWTNEATEDRREYALRVIGTFDHGGCTLPNGEHHWSAWSAIESGQTTIEAVRAQRLESMPEYFTRCDRWITHYTNRLEYERAMLSESGGTVADKTGPEKGGACKCWASPRGGWSIIQKVNKVSVTLLDSWGNGGPDFTRTIPFDKLAAIMTKAEVDEARAAGRLISETPRGFGLLDAPPPDPEPEPESASAPVAIPDPKPDFDALRQSLRAGVQVVSAPQLFPTPVSLACRMARLAGVREGMEVLEPSAGTGRIAEAIRAEGAKPFLVEIDGRMCENLSRRFAPSADAAQGICRNVLQGDFLEMGPSTLDTFDAILMNPPFQNADDIKHIQHARRFLKPGARLVAICANGPRQREALMNECEHWEDLPAGTFAESGTSVNTALLVMRGVAQ